MFLRDVMRARCPAVDPDRAVHLKAVPAIRINQLHRCGTVFVLPLLGALGIDALRAKEILRAGHNEHCRQRLQRLMDRCRRLIVVPSAVRSPDHIRVHLVIRRRLTPRLRQSQAPARLLVLANHIVQEHVCPRSNRARIIARPQRNRAHHGRVTDWDRPCIVTRTIRPTGETSVERIADSRFWARTRQRQIEGGANKAAPSAEENRR